MESRLHLGIGGAKAVSIRWHLDAELLKKCVDAFPLRPAGDTAKNLAHSAFGGPQPYRCLDEIADPVMRQGILGSGKLLQEVDDGEALVLHPDSHRSPLVHCGNTSKYQAGHGDSLDKSQAHAGACDGPMGSHLDGFVGNLALYLFNTELRSEALEFFRCPIGWESDQTGTKAKLPGDASCLMDQTERSPCA